MRPLWASYAIICVDVSCDGCVTSAITGLANLRDELTTCKHVCNNLLWTEFILSLTHSFQSWSEITTEIIAHKTKFTVHFRIQKQKQNHVNINMTRFSDP